MLFKSSKSPLESSLHALQLVHEIVLGSKLSQLYYFSILLVEFIDMYMIYM